MWFFNFEKKKTGTRGRKSFGEALREFAAERWRIVVGVSIFSIVVSVIAFLGRPPHTPVVFKGMQVVYGYNAPFSFSYESDFLRKKRQEEESAKINPVYKVDEALTARMTQRCEEIAKKISEHFDEIKKESDPDKRFGIVFKFFESATTPDETDINKSVKNILALVDGCETRERFDSLSEQSIEAFKELANSGIGDPEQRKTKEYALSSRRTTENFRGDFSRELFHRFWETTFKGGSVEKSENACALVVDLFSPMIRPNVVFDMDETRRRQHAAADAVPVIVVNVREGSPLLISGETVDDATLERWLAFRKNSRPDSAGEHFHARFFVDLLCVLCVVAAACLYQKMLVPLNGRPVVRRFRFAGVMTVLNILVVRGVLELSESDSIIQELGAHGDSLVWLASPALVAVTVSAIAGASLGVLASFFTSAVVALMLGGSIQILLMFVAASLVAVLVAQDASKRSRLVRASVYSGLAMAATAVLSGYYGETMCTDNFSQILGNSLVAVLAGVVYGVVSSGLLSVLEGVFNIRSNISLNEISDYEHPLLHKMRDVAPGTFQHCLTVANYADAAARKVGANASLCRCAALFHDVGKTLKPEFFTENQGSEGQNPHDDLTPQISALVIKGHVKDGLALAEEWNLPVRVRDIISQHHGTRVVGYFFKKAKDLAVANGDDPNTAIDEKQFRYDGPKPQTIEAAIVMMCDVVEAASRSMSQKQSVEEFVEKLIQGCFKEGEFDECPITLAQISAIQASLVKSLTDAGHSRISYPKEAGGVGEPEKK